MHLRNNSSANAAVRTGDRPAPTLYFGQRMNYCAWEGGTPPEPGPGLWTRSKGETVGTALDLFAGAGGWSLACERLGIDETGVEIMPAALETRAAAGFKSHETGDVWDFPFHEHRGLFDGLIASPPCQTFSTAGKGAGRKALDLVLDLITTGVWKDKADLKQAAVELGDERTALVLTPLHAAWELRPEWIAWEQVPTVLPVWEACAEVLRGLGYSVWTGNLQAEQYGVPQTRKRAFLLAHREREVSAPVPTHSKYYSRSPEKLDPGVEKWVSMAEALLFADVVDPGSGDPTPTGLRSNYGTGGDPRKRGERSLSEPAPTTTSKVDRNKWVYRGWGLAARPSFTVCGVSSHAVGDSEWGGGSVRKALREAAESGDPRVWAPPVHDVRNSAGNVRVTVQEAGILQSFPADFPWQGAKTKQYLQCGNAVPPLLAEAVLRVLV